MITENHIKRNCEEEVLYRGRTIVRHNGVKTINVTREMGTYMIKGYVQGARGSLYYNRIEIEENNYIYGECECPDYHTYQGICEHNVGMLYKFIQGMEEGTIRVRDLDEVYGKEVLDFYEEELIKDSEGKKKENIRIQPKLCQITEETYGLELSIGSERHYVIKNITEFVENILEQKDVTYGKKLSFIHTIDAFEEESQQLLRFVIEQVVTRQNAIDSITSASRYATGDRKVLPLSTEAFDRFFKQYTGTEIDYVDEYSKGRIKFLDTNPKLVFDVDQQRQQFILSIQQKKYELLDYPLYKYIVLNNCIYRCSDDYAKKVIPLLRFMKQMYPPQLKFDENGWKRFIMTVLPKIKYEVAVRMEDEVIRSYTPPQLTIKFFLDQDEQRRIIGNVEFNYEGYCFNPYERGKSDEKGIVRDVLKEHIFNQLLENYQFKVHKGKIFIEEEDEIYLFLSEGIDKFIKISEVHVTEQLKKIKISHLPITSVGIKVNGNLLELDFGRIDLSVEEMESILYAYRQKSKYYRIKNGSFIQMNHQGMDEFMALVDGIGLKSADFTKGKVDIPLHKSLYLDQILRGSEEINSIRDKYFKQIVRTVRNVEDTDFEVPHQLKGILRPYQKFGFRWLKTMLSYGFGAILADDMGLGKTLQVITVILSEQEHKGVSLVVAPTSLVLNWEREFQKFAPQLKVEVIHGGGSVRQEKLGDIASKDILITSYDSLKRDLEYYKDIHFRFCIADEAHYIKNPTTQNARALKCIKSDIRFALTGTPIENSLAELWSLFDFIMPDYLFTYQHFKGKFETPIMRAEDSRAMKYLQKLITPFILRRLKKEVLKELPDKTETIVYNQMEGEQERLYKANIMQMQKELAKELAQKGLGRSHIKILTMLTRLRQICCHPGLYIEDYAEESSKLIQCMELVEEAVQGGHKILLFSQFTSMLDKITEKLVEKKVSYYKLTGSTKIEERLRMVEQFNQDDTSVFLISLKAGGTGLNLTGADIVIHYDPWWNVTSENQATDRAYRLGQDKKVQVFKLITQNSIEEKIKQLQEKKIGLAEELLTEGGKLMSKLSDEEIKELFTVY